MVTSHMAVFDGYEAKAGHWRKWVAEHYIEEFDLIPGTLLDVGCGAGFWSGIFAEAGFDVTGFDVNPEYIEEAKNRYVVSGGRVVQFETADMFGRSFAEAGMFDVVFARTLPAFYDTSLAGFQSLVMELLRHTSGTLLISAYTDGSGKDTELSVGGKARHHPHQAMLAVVREAGGNVFHWTYEGGYLNIGVRP